MHRPGLLPKKIKRRGGGMATYWVRPDQAAAEKLHAAKHGELRVAPAETAPAGVHSLTTVPAMRRGTQPLGGPRAPEPLLIPRKISIAEATAAFDTPREVTPGNVRGVFAEHKTTIDRVSLGLQATFGNVGSGVRGTDIIKDQLVSMVLGPGVEAAYTKSSGMMMLKSSVAAHMGDGLANGAAGVSPEAADSIRVWAHETLHAASNRNRPDGETLSATSQPDRWLEEATTELLAHHYSAAVQRALCGGEYEGTVPPVLKKESAVLETTVSSGVAYRAQCQRFMNVSLYVVGAKNTDSREAIEAVIMGHAAEVKKRGTDRYEYLASEVLKAHGVTRETEKYQEAEQSMVVTLKNYLGRGKVDQNEPGLEGMIAGAIQAVYPQGMPKEIAPEPVKPGYIKRGKALKVSL